MIPQDNWMICATVDWKDLPGNILSPHIGTFFFPDEETFLNWLEYAHKEAEAITYYNLEAI